MSQIELESKFEKINLEESPCSKSKEETGTSKCECKKLLEHSGLKVKDRRKNLIKPSRLKMIGSCWTRNSRVSGPEEASTDEAAASSTTDDFDTFASDAFLKMRITSKDMLTHSPSSPSEEKDGKVSPASQPNSCSAQAKLQQQFSSSEFDSSIDEMSEILAFHLKIYSQDTNYLVDSMYT